MDVDEQRILLAQTREWWSEPTQVACYREEVASGPTTAEERLLRALPYSGRVLDLGTGAGRIAFYLADRGYDVTGVDVSEPVLAAARELGAQRGSPATFAHVEALTLPFEAATFDAATAFKVHCYIPSQAARFSYVNEVGRVLRPGAPLLLVSYIVPTEQEAVDALESDPDHLRAASRFNTLEPLDTFAGGRGYVHWFTPDSLSAELASSPLFDLESLIEDSPGGLLRFAVLRRRRTPRHPPDR
jgi:SAM-dependent methyltransferase